MIRPVNVGQPRKRRTAKRLVRPEPASASTLTEDAYRLIKWLITTVQLAPGARFTEPDLAKALSLSRTPVREALLLLRTEGLVAVEGRAGYRVSPVTLRDVHDLAHVRRVLEGEAAFLAASRLAQAGELEALAARVPGAPDLAEQSAATSWIESDRRFHVALAVAAGNQQLLAALGPVLERSSRLMHFVLALDSAPARITHAHEKLLTALRAHDGERARVSVVEQVSDLEDAVARALMFSQSLLSANVVVEKPSNEFYLDAPASAMDSEEEREPPRRRSTRVERTSSKRSRSEVTR